MAAAGLLTDAAIFLLIVALWDGWRREGRLTAARRTWLLVAGIFAGVSAALHLFL